MNDSSDMCVVIGGLSLRKTQTATKAAREVFPGVQVHVLLKGRRGKEALQTTLQQVAPRFLVLLGEGVWEVVIRTCTAKWRGSAATGRMEVELEGVGHLVTVLVGNPNQDVRVTLLWAAYECEFARSSSLAPVSNQDSSFKSARPVS